MKKTRFRRKHKPLFDPNAVTTALQFGSALDLIPHAHEQVGCEQAVYFATSQVKACTSKYEPVGTDGKLLEAKAFAAFLSTNEDMAEVNRNADFPYGRCHRGEFYRSSLIDRVHIKARALVHLVLGYFDEDEWFHLCKHGSGSTIGVKFHDTSMERKSTWPITVTNACIPYMNRYLEWDVVYSHLRRNAGANTKYEVVAGSRATTVSKTAEKRRHIAPIPTANAFLQQGQMLMMYERLRRFGVDVGSQPFLHKKLARLGSVTGKLATVDWSEASNRIGIELVRWLAPPKWFNVWMALRSPVMEVGKDTWFPLNMLSCMGDPITFPIETLIFWAYAHACVSAVAGDNGILVDWESQSPHVTVFGDDCILPSSAVDLFTMVLERVGMKVNVDKTHFQVEDKFRESCGGDYYRWTDVRPYTIRSPQGLGKAQLESWLYTLTNGFIEKYIQYFGPLCYVYDKHVFRVLAETFRECKIKPKLVPADFPEDSGIRDLDGLRFFREYELEASPIHVNKHGSLTFHYLRFVYKTELQKDDEVQWWAWMKRAYLRPPLPAASDHWFGYSGPDNIMVNRSATSITLGKASPREQNLGVPEPGAFRLDGGFKRLLRRGGGYVVARGLSGHWSCSLI